MSATRGARLLLPELLLTEDEQLAEGVGVAIDTDSGRIEAIAPHAALRARFPAAEVTPLPGRALLPGPVNVHSHAFQILLRGRADQAATFRIWVDEHMYPLVGRVDADELEAACLLAFSEMALHGITTVGEFYYLHRARDLGADSTTLDRLVTDCARRVGIRVVLVRALYDGEGHEAKRRFHEAPDEAAAATRGLHAHYADDPFVTVLPAPHSLHGASRAMIEAGHALAVELDSKLHIHLAEQSHDLAFSQERYGATPLRALEQIGVVDERLCVVHGVWLDPDEWTLLGERRGGLLYNPSANMFLGDGITKLELAVRAGVRVGLGCDGPGGNNALNPFQEMRLAEMLQRAAQCRMGVLKGAMPGCVCAPFVMGTEGSARNLGLDAGGLREGALGDAIAVDLEDPTLQPLLQTDAGWSAEVLLNNLVFAASIRSCLTDSFVGGRPVVRNRELVTVPREERREAAARVRSR